MGLLGWLRRRTPKLDGEHLPTHLVQETTDYVIRMTDPRLTLVPRHREKLAPAVSACLNFLREQRTLLPLPRELSASQWASDPCLKAMFVKADDVDAALAHATELREFFAHAPLLEEAHAVMGMAIHEQTVLGMALKGEMVQRDVAQTTVSFSDHRIRLFGNSEGHLWHAIARRLVDEFALTALARMQSEQQDRKSLETDTALLRARLRTFERRGAGVGSFLGEQGTQGSSDTRKLLHQLEANERKLKAMGCSSGGLERQLDVLREVFSAPAALIEVTQCTVRLDAMNRVVTAAQDGCDITYNRVRVKREDAPVERAFVPVRVQRCLPAEAGLQLDRAAALLG